MGQYVEIITTASSEKELELIAESLINDKLAACVQIAGPIKSFYRWEGRVTKSVEWECRIKTVTSLQGKVEFKIKELHSYDLPQIVVLPLVGGSEDYLGWIEDSIKKA